MPLYDYECGKGHRTEAKGGYEDSSIPCAECGVPAARVAIYREQGIITASAPSRFTVDHERFADRAPYVNDAYERAEQEVGKPLKRPEWFNAGIARARANAIERGDSRSLRAVSEVAKRVDAHIKRS